MIEQRSDSSIQRERSIKHHKLLRYIEGYKRTSEEIKKLERIKANTVMEINLRFLRSEHNRKYKFPKLEESDDEDSVQHPTFPDPGSKESKFYDLRAQNEVQKGKTIPSRILSLEATDRRRIKSLEREKGSLQKERIIRLNLKKKQLSAKKLRRNSIFEDKQHKSNIKLPQITNFNIKKDNCLTEGPDYQFNEVIGKKLLTEASTTTLKPKGVEKYVRDMKKQKETSDNIKKRANKILPRQLY